MSLIKYILRIADSSLISAQRLSEWCSKGPTLEEDIALSNISLDLLGQANGFLEYVSEIDGVKSADDFAFKRNEREYFNLKITEQPNGHFGDTIIKLFFFSSFNFLFYTELCKSKDDKLSALAHKSLKEVKYHIKHSKSWILRLGDGTEESKNKIQKSINSIWQFTGEFFEMDKIDNEIKDSKIGVDNKLLKERWTIMISETLREANLKIPKDGYMQTGSKSGLHTEYLGHLLSEMQYLQRSYPDAKW